MYGVLLWEYCTYINTSRPNNVCVALDSTFELISNVAAQVLIAVPVIIHTGMFLVQSAKLTR